MICWCIYGTTCQLWYRADGRPVSSLLKAVILENYGLSANKWNCYYENLFSPSFFLLLSVIPGFLYAFIIARLLFFTLFTILSIIFSLLFPFFFLISLFYLLSCYSISLFCYPFCYPILFLSDCLWFYVFLQFLLLFLFCLYAFHSLPFTLLSCSPACIFYACTVHFFSVGALSSLPLAKEGHKIWHPNDVNGESLMFAMLHREQTW